MKTHSAILIGCGAILFILVAAFLAGYFLFRGPQGASIASGTWLVLDPSGEVTDYNEIRSSGFFGLGQYSAQDICGKIRLAAKDSKVKGLIIRPGAALVNFANLNEINAAIQDFKAAKKPVLAHGEILAQRDYLLCAMADKVYMTPTATGGLILEGVSSNVLFFKEMLQKIGVRMHVMQAGEFKGAGEPYSQTQLSPGTEENLRKVLKSRYDLLQADIARYRKLDTLAVRNIYEARPDLIIPASQAREYGLIDETASWDEFLEKNGIDGDKSVSLSDYGKNQSLPVAGAKVAVVNLSGNITPSQGFSPEALISADKVDEIMDAIEEEANVKAVVLRVNSPGGSATESELIYQRIKRLDIPVVVSMGGIAASGGYYISCAGDYIMADPHTITGSIGVIMALPEAVELGNKLGIDSQTLSYGKFAGFGSVFEAYDTELLSSLKRNSEAVYTEFKQRVMDARQIGPEEIANVAEGRVFSASDARAVKLVDEIGDLNAAVKKAAELAGISKYGTQNYPQQISIWEMFQQKGFFQMAARLISGRDLSLEQRLLAYLQLSVPTRQWLYLAPYSLD